MTEGNLFENLLSAVTRLSTHIEKENALLQSRDTAALEALAAEKDRLSQDYTKTVMVLRRNPALVSQADREMKARLRQAGEEFNTVMEAHRRLVTAMKSVNEGMVKAISDQVASKNRVLKSYGGGGLPQPAPETVPTSIALDRQV